MQQVILSAPSPRTVPPQVNQSRVTMDYPVEEKHPEYFSGRESPSPDQEHEFRTKADVRKGSKINEATDVFGDIQTAEEYGYVSRG